MTTIHQEDFVASVADALQFISFYHPSDFIQAMTRAYHSEEGVAAKDAIGQILTNSRLCALGHRPICQDTGIVIAFVEVGMDVRWATKLTVEEMVNEGVHRAYTNTDNPLRGSIVTDPAGKRKITPDNTPAVVHTILVLGNSVTVYLSAKGGGSENKAKLAMLNPSDDLVDWVVQTVEKLGAGWCPPGLLGVGIGGTAEKAAILAKQALLEPVDMPELKARGPKSTEEELRITLYDRINTLGIGAQGLGGLTTVLDVKVRSYPTHAASKPVAIVPNCAATRHIHFTLDGNGPALLEPPSMDDWPEIDWQPAATAHRVDLDTLSREAITAWKPGETLLLSGRLLTGRDAAHKRLVDLLAKGEAFPNGLDFHNKLIYYVGPVNPTANEVIGPAGPTTATRMDKFTETILAKTGLLGMIGKAERGPEAIDAIKRHRATYLIATGGAAYLVAKAIKSSRIVAFPELGMEAIHEFIVKDMPVTVAVDVNGESIHQTGPALWKTNIIKMHARKATETSE